MNAAAQDVVSTLTVTSMLDMVERSLHASTTEWVFLRELRVGVGRHRQSMQRLDAFALNCLPHLAMKRVCYEIKLSRSDFLCEVKNPCKRRIGLHFSNEFFFVAPTGMLSLDEVPTHCGLIEIGSGLVISVAAPWRDAPAPTWQFTAAMLRNQQRALREKVLPAPRQQKFDLG